MNTRPFQAAPFQMADALAAIRARTALAPDIAPDTAPDIALVLGSGMGALAEAVAGVRIPYSDVPGLVPSTVQSHAGEFVVGELAGRSVVAMAGRVHMYEGHSADIVTRPVRVMHGLMEAGMGARTLVVTNAAGGLRGDLAAGDIAVIEDHVSLVNLSGGDPLRGTEARFQSMNRAYSPQLIAKVEAAARSIGQPVARGVYVHAVGPSFETPAEVRFLRGLGDMVGMSTVPEVMVARSLGMEVLALSGISNACVGELDSEHVTTAEDAWETLAGLGPRMAALVEAVLPDL